MNTQASNPDDELRDKVVGAIAWGRQEGKTAGLVADDVMQLIQTDRQTRAQVGAQVGSKSRRVATAKPGAKDFGRWVGETIEEYKSRTVAVGDTNQENVTKRDDEGLRDVANAIWNADTLYDATMILDSYAKASNETTSKESLQAIDDETYITRSGRLLHQLAGEQDRQKQLDLVDEITTLESQYRMQRYEELRERLIDEVLKNAYNVTGNHICIPVSNIELLKLPGTDTALNAIRKGEK